MPLVSRLRRRLPAVPLVLYGHPFELALGAALVVNGLRGLVDETSPSMLALPETLRYAYHLISALGGIGVIVGLSLTDPPRRVGLGRALERASLFVVAASYLGVGALLVGYNGSAGFGQATVTALVATACLLRAKAIRKAALVILSTLTQARHDAEGDRHE